MLSQVTLHDSGLVVCRDENGMQSPSLQGMFPDVADKIRQIDLDIKWVLRKGKEEREVSRDEWFEAGKEIIPRGMKSAPLPPHIEMLIRSRSQDERDSSNEGSGKNC